MNIGTIEELVNVVVSVATRIVEIGTKETTTGNWVIDYDDVADLIQYEDYLTYFDLILTELCNREEVLDVDPADKQFDCIFALDYCPNYIWLDGDEERFGCPEEGWAPLEIEHPHKKIITC